jgi:hypothetical protein
MKKMYLISLIIVVAIVGLFVFSKHQIIGKKLEISFVTAQTHTQKDLVHNGCLNDFEWIIISGESQRKNLEQGGYIIPHIDFSKNYLIISRYKISKLYRKAGRNRCLGVPDGQAIFDKKNSNKDFYYFYLMPKIMLSQGVG